MLLYYACNIHVHLYLFYFDDNPMLISFVVNVIFLIAGSFTPPEADEALTIVDFERSFEENEGNLFSCVCVVKFVLSRVIES